VRVRKGVVGAKLRTGRMSQLGGVVNVNGEGSGSLAVGRGYPEQQGNRGLEPQLCPGGPIAVQ
jgi:hypothetical protein